MCVRVRDKSRKTWKEEKKWGKVVRIRGREMEGRKR